MCDLIQVFITAITIILFEADDCKIVGLIIDIKRVEGDLRNGLTRVTRISGAASLGFYIFHQFLAALGLST